MVAIGRKEPKYVGMSRKKFEFILEELEGYESCQAAMERLREDVAYSHEPPDEGATPAAHVSKPTEAKGILLASSLALVRLAEFSKQVARARNRLNVDEERVFRYLFLEREKPRPPGPPWENLGMSERTFYRHRRSIVYRVGKEMGLVSIEVYR